MCSNCLGHFVAQVKLERSGLGILMQLFKPYVPCRPVQSWHSCLSTMPKKSSAGQNMEGLSLAAS